MSTILLLSALSDMAMEALNWPRRIAKLFLLSRCGIRLLLNCMGEKSAKRLGQCCFYHPVSLGVSIKRSPKVVAAFIVASRIILLVSLEQR